MVLLIRNDLSGSLPWHISSIEALSEWPVSTLGGPRHGYEASDLVRRQPDGPTGMELEHVSSS
jgi:hypothetical protein